MEADYQNWLKIKKLQKNDQVKEYRSILETQMQLQAVKQETDRRSQLGFQGGTVDENRSQRGSSPNGGIEGGV